MSWARSREPPGRGDGDGAEETKDLLEREDAAYWTVYVLSRFAYWLTTRCCKGTHRCYRLAPGWVPTMGIG
jgi:hypothetical protein